MFRYVAWGSLLCVLAGPLSARAQSTGKPFSLAPIGSPPAATAENSSAGSEKVQWRSPRKGTPPLAIRPQATTAARSSTTSGGTIDVTPVRNNLTPSAARVTPGDGKLPADRGQVWREYDISPYTSKVTNTEKPQQAIVDWVLRETGTDLWFTDAVGLLNADRNTLRVYHTPEVQRIVADVVDRFVIGQAENYTLGLRLVTVGNPNWRAKVHTLMRPVSVQSPGVDAWLMSKENAALLIAELRKRTDYRELNAPTVSVANGQSQTIAQQKLQAYTSGVRLKEVYPYYEAESGQINEGYSLEISPLFSADGQTMDVVLKCHIDQLEKLIPVTMEIPQGTAAPLRVPIQVPQVVSWRLHERFRWPSDQVLLLSCGVVASPTGEKVSPLGIPGLGSAPGRADALLLIESHGKVDDILPDPPRPTTIGVLPQTRGRY